MLMTPSDYGTQQWSSLADRWLIGRASLLGKGVKVNNNNNNLIIIIYYYLKSNIQCTYRYEFNGSI